MSKKWYSQTKQDKEILVKFILPKESIIEDEYFIYLKEFNENKEKIDKK